MNVKHMTKARANTHLLISLYFLSGVKLINILLTLISTALVSPFPFCEQLSIFFAKLFLFKLMLFLSLRRRINILLRVWDVRKIFTTGAFPHVLNQNLCPLFERKGEGDGWMDGWMGLRSRSTFQNLESTMWLAKHGKGMLSSVQQTFVGRDEKRAPLKTAAREVRMGGERWQ